MARTTECGNFPLEVWMTCFEAKPAKFTCQIQSNRYTDSHVDILFLMAYNHVIK